MEFPTQDCTDYQDTIGWLADFAEGMEIEIPYNEPAKSARLREAASKLREVITLLEPLADDGQ